MIAVAVAMFDGTIVNKTLDFAPQQSDPGSPLDHDIGGCRPAGFAP
jgi:hypothetical protein